jgi:hypothetical protein
MSHSILNIGAVMPWALMSAILARSHRQQHRILRQGPKELWLDGGEITGM